MEPFIVSARKYRPQTFKDVVGQQSITNTLQNAIDQNHLAQALLFCGPRGVGKTTCARILAKQINSDGTEQENEDFAFNIFELDAASNNSVDDIRNLIDQVRIPPQVGKYKVYIIDEVHMLSQSAFNAFLKTLEEPPKHAIFILATTEKHKIIPTILSRCQIFDFKRITVKDAAEYLKYIAESQGVNAEDDALHIIAQKADGAMRDALSIFDRVVSFSGSELTRKAVTENLNVLDYDTYFEATDLILEHNIPGLLLLFNKTLSLGFDGHHFISGLASHFRDLMVCQHPDTINLLEVGEAAQQLYRDKSKKTAPSFLLQGLEISNDCDLKYKTSKNQRLLVELTLMKLASINFDGEKKNPESVALNNQTIDFIAPSAFYNQAPKKESEIKPVTGNQPATTKTEGPKETISPNKTTETAVESKQALTTAETQVAPVKTKEPQQIIEKAPITEPVSEAKKPIINRPTKRVSGLSISSLNAKKQHELNKIEVVIDENNLPKDNFTEEELRKHWADFIEIIDKKGQKILASNLHSDIPKLKDNFAIHLELPNGTMKKEIEREQFELMEYLRAKLNNHFVHLEITVNETTVTKFAFTPEEKYEKLREKNPVIDLLRQEFDLFL
ncbi:DNA polymerase III subunit gamma/tau [Maribacter hydrothermalis]|uniref:DNA polymerase III subunit gamma/tau n=1 Tax=Maribacter hydrothermalis TaxID=1836467 RepID=A0A1B7ZBQ6_9FLAO|nr:DNA polymerase III subunit gamma/tau [Maribacter hydrothermalis]APQ16293.1 DNA polymerase III subunit gamma/tau [Maribacter hydrothermalis]OBR40138.1 DNA polymerase III, subunit gamma and tau [Maribacter hydrothermalis]